MNLYKLSFVLLVAAGLSCAPAQRPDHATVEPRQGGASVNVSIDSLLASMTLEEKVGQMVMIRATGVYMNPDHEEFQRLATLVRDRRVGGLIMVQGDVYEAAMTLNRLQAQARIPLLISSDLERGLAMRIRRTTYFGDAMAIGATGNSEYAYLAGRGTAEEARAIGIHQNYAPVADVNTNPDNPVINTRSFGDDLPLVRRMVGAFVRGTADGGVIATVKHFPGHGDTGVDSHLELPVLHFTRQRLDSLELAPFKAAIDSGAQSIMIAHLAVPALNGDASTPSSLSYRAVTTVLRGELKFGGLVVTDAMDMKGAQRSSISQAVIAAVNAGVDIVLMTSEEDIALDALVRGARRGEVSVERIDASVRRILAAKRDLGLLQNRFVSIDSIASHVGTERHRAVANAIARDAMTVVRNEDNILPLSLSKKKRVVALMISDTDDNRTEIFRPSNPFPNEQFGSYFIQQLQRRHRNVEAVRLTPSSTAEDFAQASQRMRGADLLIVPVYVKVRTSSGRISLPDNVKSWLAREPLPRIPSVVVSLGNPYLLRDFAGAKALVAAYSDTEPFVDAAVEAIFGEIPVRGKLPVTIPGLAPFGSGVSLAVHSLRAASSHDVGFNAAETQHLSEIVRSAIRDSAFPGAELTVIKDGVIVFNKAFGNQEYASASPEIDLATMYDLASVTKVIATTAAVMKLVDEGKLSVDDRVGKYIPQYASGEKSGITIRHLLLHRGGLPPFRQLWKFCPNGVAAVDTIFTTPLVAQPGDSTIYSDLGLITVGKVVEKISGMPLDQFVTREFYEPLGMTRTMFNPPAMLRDNIAPTEYDSSWRKTLVRGIVHDENACFLGGVAGHAGLFATSSDLAIFMQMLMNGGTYGGRRYLKQSTIDHFIREKSPGQERWLGWDMKSPSGSSAGDLLSLSSFGHTGFTGTSIWADPEKRLVVIFLTNRVYPTRANGKLGRVRPAVHNAVASALAPLP